MRFVFVRRVTACALVLSSSLSATVYHTSSTPAQEALDKVQPGDAIKFDSKVGAVAVNKPISGVQFICGSAQWVLNADVVDCDFVGHNPSLFKQRSGKLRRTSFYFTHYGVNGIELCHADSVCFCFAGQWFKPQSKPRLELYGFVRSVTIHKPVLEPDHGEAVFNADLAPVAHICAWDPVGNGQGTSIISPIIWDGRADTYFHVVRGTGITFAHCNTEYTRWSDPVVHFDNTINCYPLCNGIGAASDATNSEYKEQPTLIDYGDHVELGHFDNTAPFRGAAYRMGGINNKSVASGSYKTWSIGIKAWLPSLHYDDAITTRDPWFEDWCWQRGASTVGFAEPKSQFMYDEGEVKQYGRARYPIDGADVPAPYFRRMPKTILAKRGLGKAMSPSRIEAVRSMLARGETVELAEGTFVFDQTLTSGEIVGAGRDKTVIRFLGKGATATGAFRGYSNCTVSGGSWGFVNSGYVLGSKFFRTVFKDNTEGGILINDNTQNDCIQDAEFYGGKYGIKTGTNSNTVDPNVDKLDIINCHFEGQSVKGIELYTDPGCVKCKGGTQDERPRLSLPQRLQPRYLGPRP